MPDAVITVENLSAELPARPANRAGKPATLRTRQAACSVGAEAPTPTRGKRASMGCLCRDEHLYQKQQGKQPMPEQSNCKSFGDLSVRSAGWFGARQKSLRLIDRVPGRFDLLAQLRNLATTRRDQFSRQCALSESMGSLPGARAAWRRPSLMAGDRSTAPAIASSRRRGGFDQ